MYLWRVDSFEVETERGEWTIDDADGDRINYRTGIGPIYIPAGVQISRLSSSSRGLYADRDVPMTDPEFQVRRWSEEEIIGYERWNGYGSFNSTHIRVSVDYLDD
jgi:hypothetical protein